MTSIALKCTVDRRLEAFTIQLLRPIKGEEGHNIIEPSLVQIENKIDINNKQINTKNEALLMPESYRELGAIRSPGLTQR
jgi:hypothetical protein